MRPARIPYLLLATAVVASPALCAEEHSQAAPVATQQAAAPAAAAPATGQNPEPCFACHGPKGYSNNPMYPSLAGQYQDYIVASLKAYKTGERKNPIMAGMAAPLTDKDIKHLGAYFAGQKGPLYTPKIK